MNDIYENFNKNLIKEISELGIKREICLIAASKYYGKEEIINLFNKGQKHFGENRLQEALPKINELEAFDITWHFFGHIQKNKAKKIAEYFSFIHSVDSLEIAIALNNYALQLKKELKIFLQVNLAGEKQKFGFNKITLLNCVSQIIKLNALKVMGLMIIPPNYENSEDKKIIFQELKKFQTEINSMYNTDFKSLSMGMSGDWKEALSVGATHLRVGRALFE